METMVECGSLLPKFLWLVTMPSVLCHNLPLRRELPLQAREGLLLFPTTPLYGCGVIVANLNESPGFKAAGAIQT